MGIVNSLLHVTFVFFGLAMIGLILIRRGEGGGLGGALGGGMGDTMFGPRATKSLDKLIGWCTGFFLLSAVLMYTSIGGRAGGLDTVDTKPGKSDAKPVTPEKPADSGSTPPADSPPATPPGSGS